MNNADILRALASPAVRSPQTAREVAAWLFMYSNARTVRRRLEAMEDAGWVSRREHPDGKPGAFWEITDAGRQRSALR